MTPLCSPTGSVTNLQKMLYHEPSCVESTLKPRSCAAVQLADILQQKKRYSFRETGCERRVGDRVEKGGWEKVSKTAVGGWLVMGGLAGPLNCG